MTVSSSNMQIYSSMASASTFLPKNNTKHDVGAKRKVEKVAEKREMKENKGKGKEKVVEHTPAIFLSKPAKKPHPTESINPKPIPSIDSAPDFGLDHNNNDSGGSDNKDNSEDGKGPSIINPACLVDIKTKSVNNLKNGGWPMHSLLNDLVQKCYNTQRLEKHIYHCKGGCGKTFSNRNGAWILRHATGCHRLPPEPQKQAKAEVASNVLSRQLDIDDPESTKIVSETSDVEGKGNNGLGPGGVIVMKKWKFEEVVEVVGLPSNPRLRRLHHPHHFLKRPRCSAERRDIRSLILQLSSSSAVQVSQCTSQMSQILMFGKICYILLTQHIVQHLTQSWRRSKLLVKQKAFSKFRPHTCKPKTTLQFHVMEEQQMEGLLFLQSMCQPKTERFI